MPKQKKDEGYEGKSYIVKTTNQMIALYENGLSMTDIGNKFGMSRQAISLRFHKMEYKKIRKTTGSRMVLHLKKINRCRICGDVKPFKDFYIQPKTQRVCSYCKKCYRDMMIVYHKTYMIKNNIYEHDIYMIRKSYFKEYTKRNRKRINQYMQAYVKKNGTWASNNPEKSKIYHKKRYHEMKLIKENE